MGRPRIYAGDVVARKKANKSVYYRKHRDRLREYRRIIRPLINSQLRSKYQENARYKLSILLRRRLQTALKRAHIPKVDSTYELIGCSVSEAKFYLEEKFKEGMTWQNHSFAGWHIDHVVPISFFDLNDPIQVKQAFHYTNLQPLWAQENLCKSNKFIPS